jgi:hypothetical protein
MGAGDLRTLVREAVIDITGRLQKKKSDAFADKVKDLASSITGAFDQQREQEAAVSDAFDELPVGVDKIVGQKRFRLACPLAFSGDEGWPPDTSVYTIVSLLHPRDYSYEQVARYIAANADVFADSVRWLDDTITGLEKTFDAMDWPAPWRRYTSWGSITRDVQRYTDIVEDITGQEIV